MPDASFPALCFGKLPAHADFVRYNAASREVLAFDEWLHQGLYFSRTQLGSSWDQVFASSPRYSFVFTPESADRCVAGIMQPSHDKSQRRYPFLVSLLLDRRRFTSIQFNLLPIILSGFIHRAAEFVRRALNGMEMREIADQTQMLGLERLSGNDQSLVFQREFLERETVDSFFGRVFGSFEDRRKYLVFKNLVEVLAPFKNRSLLRLNLGLRFPLSGDSRTAGYEVCFWTHVCLAMLGGAAFTPVLFWSSGGNANHLFLFFRQPSARNFLNLLKPDSISDAVCIVEEEGKEKISTAHLSLPAGYRNLIENGNLTLEAFLETIMRALSAEYHR